MMHEPMIHCSTHCFAYLMHVSRFTNEIHYLTHYLTRSFHSTRNARADHTDNSETTCETTQHGMGGRTTETFPEATCETTQDGMDGRTADTTPTQPPRQPSTDWTYRPATECQLAPRGPSYWRLIAYRSLTQLRLVVVRRSSNSSSRRGCCIVVSSSDSGINCIVSTSE